MKASTSSFKYLADEEILGFKFSYPSQYLESIAWAHRDIDDGGDGHALAFLVRDEIATELKFFVRAATREPLVPFARGGNGDELYCFSGKEAGQVYVTVSDLPWTRNCRLPWQRSQQGSRRRASATWSVHTS